MLGWFVAGILVGNHCLPKLKERAKKGAYDIEKEVVKDTLNGIKNSADDLRKKVADFLDPKEGKE